MTDERQAYILQTLAELWLNEHGMVLRSITVEKEDKEKAS